MNKRNTKNILYVTRYEVQKNLPLNSKFSSQIAAFEDLKCNVYYIAIGENNISLINKKRKVILYKVKNVIISKLRHTLIYSLLFLSVIKVCTLGIKFDIMYIRLTPLMPFYYIMFIFGKLISRKINKIVLEIPTFPIEKEERIIKNNFKKIILHLLRILRYFEPIFVDLYAVIGEKNEERNKKNKIINISNGFNVNSVCVRKPIEIIENEINVIAVANFSQWHGYERFILGLKHYYDCQERQKCRVILHLIGPDGDGSLKKYQQITNKFGLNDFVKFYSSKTGNELDYYFSLCDLALASLGSFKRGINISSELKVREYYSRGIPFIRSVFDTELPFNSKFELIVSNDDSILDIKNIIEFIIMTRQNKNLPISMREIAFRSFNWKKQFICIFENLELL